MPDLEIAQVIFDQTGKTITDRSLCTVRQLIKKESYHWYSQLREGQYEYLHEFKERINEIYFLQKKLYEIIDNNEHNPSIQLGAIAELHKLNITLSNYFSVAPSIGNVTVSTIPETKATINDRDIIV
ncbi:MAG: hypothetical protein WBN72_08125 [Nitrososphaeraceae archaeon]